MKLTLTWLDGVLVFALVLLAIGTFVYVPKIPRWCREIRDRCRQRQAAKEADMERRWEMLRSLFLSGQLTQFDYRFQFRKGFDGHFLFLQGPGFSGGWQDLSYPLTESDTAGIKATVSAAIDCNTLAERKKIAAMIHKQIQLDEHIALLYESIVENWANLKTAPVNNVVSLRSAK